MDEQASKKQANLLPNRECVCVCAGDKETEMVLFIDEKISTLSASYFNLING